MAQAQGSYYVPHGSYWPFVGSIGLITSVVGAASYFNGDWSIKPLLFGAFIMAIMFFGWFGTVIRESVKGAYNDQVDRSFRWGMTWFIFSELMFFGAFFGSLFYARVLSVPWLSGDMVTTSQYLWNSVSLHWPTAGPGFTNLVYEPMGAWPLPTINTLLLLTSGVTITIAHHALKAGQRGKLVLFMWATVLLGSLFLCFQAYEYVHAYRDLNLRLDTGIYGSTFFMLTGFHGVHVIIGTVALFVITLRCMRGHFTADDHFGFEGVAWYWHFVDVVWLGLFIFVYVL